MSQLNLKNVMSIVSEMSKAQKIKKANDESLIQTTKETPYPNIIGSWDGAENKKAEEQTPVGDSEQEANITNKNSLESLATHLRAMQFLYHNFHNLASGPSFFSDHAFFGDSYSAIESNYDSVIEIVIGDGNIPDLKLLHFNAVKIMAELNSEDNFFNSGLVAEKTLQSLIESISKENIDQGTTNLIGAIAESSKTRTYKIKQRIA